MHKAHRDPLVVLDPQDPKVYKEPLVVRDQQDHRVTKVYKVLEAAQVQRDPQDHKVQPELSTQRHILPHLYLLVHGILLLRTVVIVLLPDLWL